MVWNDRDGLTPQNLNARGGPIFNVKDPDFGATGDGSTDDTAAIQAAIDAAVGGTLMFPEGTYMVRGKPTGSVGRLGIKPLSNSTWLFAGNAVIKVIAQASDTYAVINIDGVTDVTLYGPRVDGNKANITDAGGQGHGIFMTGGCERIRIYSARSFNCYGDGIYIGITGDTNRDIVVVGSEFSSNRRQGCSITQGRDITFLGCGFVDTAGTSPQKGALVEPNAAADWIHNINFIGCWARNNTGRNFSVAGVTDMTNPVSIHFTNCVSEDSGNEGFSIETCSGSEGVITLTGCESLNDGIAGFRLNDADLPVLIDNMFIKDCNTTQNGTARFGSAFVASIGTSDLNSGNLYITNSRVQNDSGDILFALHTIRFGGISSAFIENIKAEIITSGLTESELWDRAGNQSEYQGIFDVNFPNHPIRTIANNATPDVHGRHLIKSGGTTTITDFDGGTIGQTITLIAAHSVTITDGTPIILAGGANFEMVATDTLTLIMFDDQVWQEVARSVN